MSENKPKPLTKASTSTKNHKNILKNKEKPASAIPKEILAPKKDMAHAKENKGKDKNIKTETKDLSKSSQKVKQNNTNYKKNISMSKSNKNFSYNIRNDLPVYKTEKKDNKKINKKMMKSENNFKTPVIKETIGNKMIREEIAKEKKMCTEKIKIIRAHILSLQKKEEELEKKVIKLSNQENALGKINTEKVENTGKEENIPKDKQQNYSERKNGDQNTEKKKE